MLPRSDLKIIEKSVLVKLNWTFGLNVFDSLQEFLESFREHDKLLRNPVKGNFL